MGKPTKPTTALIPPMLRQSCSSVTESEMNRVWDNCLEEMLTLFYPPFRANDDIELTDQSVVALKRYVAELSGFDRDTLAKGWSDVLRHHKVERWPTIGTICDACRSVGVNSVRTANTNHNDWQRLLVERCDRNVRQWFNHMWIDGDVLRFKTKHARDWCEERYGLEIRQALSETGITVTEFRA